MPGMTKSVTKRSTRTSRRESSANAFWPLLAVKTLYPYSPKIVSAIESGEVGLEESIKRFEEGTQLISHCRGILADAELKIQKLQATPTGGLEAVPLDIPSGSPESD